MNNPVLSNSSIIEGVVAPAKALFLIDLTKSIGSLIAITQSIKEAEVLTADLNFFGIGSDVEINYLPPWETLPLEPVSPNILTSAQRIYALHKLANKSHTITVAPIESVLQRVLPYNLILSQSTKISVGTNTNREKLITQLHKLGYVQTTRVEGIGQCSVRGGVIDLFPCSLSNPIRLTLDDDEVESISLFDAESQRSMGELLSSIVILPLTESIPAYLFDKIGLSTKEAVNIIRERGLACETPPREVAHVTSLIKSDIPYPGRELHSMIFTKYNSLLEEYKNFATFICTNDIEVINRSEKFLEQVASRALRLKDGQILVPSVERVYASTQEIISCLDKPTTLVFDSLSLTNYNNPRVTKQRRNTRLITELSFQLKRNKGSGYALTPLTQAMDKWLAEKLSIAFVVASEERRERLAKILREEYDREIDYHYLSSYEFVSKTERPTITFVSGALSNSFQDKDRGIIFVAEQDLFPTKSFSKKRTVQKNTAKVLNSLGNLKEGDFVVHNDYGIGIYQGLKTLSIEESTGDFLQIAYADSTLYLPVFSINKVHKFAGVDGKTPKIDKLSSNRWQQTKEKVRESVEELAGELIRLYAAREASRGWKFDPSDAMDELFAEAFPHKETVDQINAVTEVFNDMTSEKPMDRLIVGDVGFGKTEIAIRAAFKATQHKKQVAVLAPTTILVEQHKRTFLSRFSDFDISISALSRLYPKKVQHETLAQLEQGSIDIIIGTHSLLSSQVHFADLGLLIIDEEHRFGVKQKEQIKQLKRHIDVLTLTATPIPRTLHMALLGIRDISVLHSAPHNRLPVHSYLAHRDSTLIRDALLREHNRGGQVFFVYNRIENINFLCDELKQLVPEMRFAFAHGQMDELTLEQIMTRFLNHEIDVLVSTTIVESGIDVPNANTIIIDQAHMLGLAQLYQLRGRVGRSNRQAYAYFLIPRKRNLTRDAHERLRVLQSLDHLGVGFELALQDLHIRGAGNLLGREQSGTVATVGFELYSRIVHDTVARLQGIESEEAEFFEPEVRVPFSCYISCLYIPSIEERLLLYQRCGEITSEQERINILEEAEERFGRPPVEFEQYLHIMELKAILRRFRIVKFELRPTEIRLVLSKDSPLHLEKLLELSKLNVNKISLGKGLTLTIKNTIEEADTDLFTIQSTIKRIGSVLESIAL
jgi:transcription-repair coupling factor (superfamily II helicase)